MPLVHVAPVWNVFMGGKDSSSRLRYAGDVTPIARALVVATVAALAADGLLAAFTAVDALGAGGEPWWVAAHLVERGRWVVFAALLVPWAARLAPLDSGSTAATWRAVGTAVIVVPLLWIAATWIVQAVLYTVAGRWDLDGRVFLELELYRRAVIGYLPWLLGGVVTRVASRHV